VHGSGEPPFDEPDLLGLDPEVEPDPDGLHHARPSLPHGLVVYAGGAAGVLARYELLALAPVGRDAVPWTLLVLNVVGAALLGLVVRRVLEPRPYNANLRLLLATGLLGGFTTYSSLVSAAVVQGHDGHVGGAVVTLLVTSVVGVAAAWAASRPPRTGR
jgi:CrcB protein